MLASLEPKLFCSVTLKERFLLMRTLIRRLTTTGRELLRYNECQTVDNPYYQSGQRLRATEPVAALLIGESDLGPKRETIRGGLYRCQAGVGCGLGFKL